MQVAKPVRVQRKDLVCQGCTSEQVERGVLVRLRRPHNGVPKRKDNISVQKRKRNGVRVEIAEIIYIIIL